MQLHGTVILILIAFPLFAACVTPDHPPFGSAPGSGIALSFSDSGFSTHSAEAESLFKQGMISSTQNARYEEALTYFDRALILDQNFTEAWYTKGVALHNLRRFDEAVICYDRALVLTPDLAFVRNLKAESLRAAGKEVEADLCFRKTVVLDPRYEKSYGGL